MASSKPVQKVDQKEYLKKYLSGDKAKKKRKPTDSKVKIIDDDVNFTKSTRKIDEELLLTGEDAPQIVGEFPEKQSNGTTKSKWRSISKKDTDSDYGRTSQDRFRGSSRQRYRSSDRNSTDHSPERRNYAGKKSPSKRYETSDLHQKFRSDSRERSASRRSRKASLDHSPLRRRNMPSPLSNKHSNISPQRQHQQFRRGSGNQSPQRRRNFQSPFPNKHGNFSPQRQHQQFRRDSRELSASRRSRKASLDQSPPRRRNFQSPFSNKRNNFSPQRQRKKSFDQSPPRRRDFRQSPYRKRVQSPFRFRNNTFSQEFHPRSRPMNRNHTYNHTQNRRFQRSSYSSPMRNQFRPQRDFQHFATRKRNFSPSRDNRNNSSDQSPRRRGGNFEQSMDRKGFHSPKRSFTNFANYEATRIKREKLSSDLSPTRRLIHKRSSPSPSRQNQRYTSSSSPPPTHKPKMSKTLDGKKAGLQDAQSLKVETDERRHREDRMFQEMSKDQSGRDAEVQVRRTGRQGQRARGAKAEDPEEGRRREEYEQKKQQLYDRWGKGVKQVEDHRRRRAEEEYESNKPLARYADDEDLEKHLRAKERLDDPMLEYMRRKNKDRQKHQNVAAAPIYEGSYPDNRFGIRPGYRWDGVDRSNGYEKKWLQMQNEKHARQEESYKYSVEDM